MEPYRSSSDRGDEVDQATALRFALGADDLIVAAVIFFIGAVVAASGFLAHPTATTPGVIGLMMMAFSVWTHLADRWRKLRA